FSDSSSSSSSPFCPSTALEENKDKNIQLTTIERATLNMDFQKVDAPATSEVLIPSEQNNLPNVRPKSGDTLTEPLIVLPHSTTKYDFNKNNPKPAPIPAPKLRTKLLFASFSAPVQILSSENVSPIPKTVSSHSILRVPSSGFSDLKSHDPKPPDSPASSPLVIRVRSPPPTRLPPVRSKTINSTTLYSGTDTPSNQSTGVRNSTVVNSVARVGEQKISNCLKLKKPFRVRKARSVAVTDVPIRKNKPKLPHKSDNSVVALVPSTKRGVVSPKVDNKKRTPKTTRSNRSQHLISSQSGHSHNRSIRPTLTRNIPTSPRVSNSTNRKKRANARNLLLALLGKTKPSKIKMLRW
ncbi:hypothetical protein HZC07_05585, partial [Candidatus Micrarchaeota archaeon]|nr:hypothetical protein [Candidatus Micrarchaeota archaeon]